MKRSFLNSVIDDAREFLADHHFLLPPWAGYSPDQWRACAKDAQEIFDLQLGWDVTSFGSGDYYHMGLMLFTLRNGIKGSRKYPKPYAEKIMVVGEGQVTPRHFHWNKREDIINRGGGNLVIELYHSDPKHNCIIETPFGITVNGFRRQLKNGDKLILTPGESVCFEPCHAHKFYGEKGSGTIMAGEVSKVNDDQHDNCFIDGVPRFDPIEEDVAPKYLLGSEYRQWLSKKA